MNLSPFLLCWQIVVLLSPSYISPKGIYVYVDPPPCIQDQTVVRLSVTNIKRIKGSVVVDVHNDIVEDFLEDDKVILRVRQTIDAHSMQVCVPLLGPGNYALAVYQDKIRTFWAFPANVSGYQETRNITARNLA